MKRQPSVAARLQPGNLYDSDFVEWTRRTAELIRKHRFAELDVEHTAEEIEDMASATSESCPAERRSWWPTS
jgi:hypothetical protein